MNSRRASLIAIFVAAAFGAGCNDDSTVEVHINGGSTKAHIVASQAPHTPTGPLTVAEQKKLLKAIQKNPDRIRTLTNRERRWLAGAVLAD